MKAKVLFGAVALFSVAACATTGVQMIGADTFLTSARVPFNGESGAKAKVLQSAAASCRADGKMMKLVSLTSHECALHGGCGEAEATFMCLAGDDPRFK